MPSFVVSTAFKTKDEMSRTFKRMGLSGNSFANKMIRNFGRINKRALSTRRIIGGILGAAAVQRGLGMAAQGVRGVTEEFLDFEDSITAASAKFGIFDRKNPAFKALGDTAREVGATTEFTASQAAGGLRFLAKAGWDANSSMKALPGLVNLATAAEVDLARASDIATDVMGAFGLKGKDAAQNMIELTRVSDVMSSAANSANVDMEELFETVKFAGPIAKTAGVSLEDFAAMAAFVGGSGIKGSMGGTALRTMFINLAAPTSKMTGKMAEFNTEIKNVKQLKNNRKDLAKLGIVVDDLGRLAPIETLKVLNERMKKLSPTAKTAALRILFGKHAVSGAAVATEGASGAMLEFQERMKNTGGEAKKVSDFMRDSISKRLDALKSSAIDVGFQFIDTFKEKFPGALESATEAIREFDIEPIVKKVRKAKKASEEFLRVLEDYKGILVGAAAGFAVLKLAPFVVSMWKVVKVAIALKTAGGFIGMFGGLAALANPVGVVVAAVVGLTAAIYALYTNWDDLTQLVKLTAMDALKRMDKVFNHKIWGHDADYFDDSGQRISLREAAKTEGNVMPTMEDLVNSTSQSAGIPGNTDKIARESVKGMAGAQRMPTSLELAQSASRVDSMVKTLADIKQRYKQSPKKSPLVPPNALAPPTQDKSLRTGDKDQSVAPQAIKFEGRLDVAGAPAGSKVSSKTRGAPPIRTEMLGQN